MPRTGPAMLVAFVEVAHHRAHRNGRLVFPFGSSTAGLYHCARTPRGVVSWGLHVSPDSSSTKGSCLQRAQQHLHGAALILTERNPLNSRALALKLLLSATRPQLVVATHLGEHLHLARAPFLVDAFGGRKGFRCAQAALDGRFGRCSWRARGETERGESWLTITGDVRVRFAGHCRGMVDVTLAAGVQGRNQIPTWN